MLLNCLNQIQSPHSREHVLRDTSQAHGMSRSFTINRNLRKAKNCLKRLCITIPLWIITRNEQAANDSNKILNIKGLMSHFLNSWNKVKTYSIRTVFPLHSSSTLSSSGPKSELWNCLWCNMSWDVWGGPWKYFMWQRYPVFFELHGKTCFPNGQDFESFLSGHWGNWKQLKILQQCSCHKQDPGSTGLRSHLMWLSPCSL